MADFHKTTQLCKLSNVLHGRELIALSATPDFKPLLLSVADRSDNRALNQFGVSFPKLFATKPNYYRIHYLIDGLWKTVDLPETKENYHFVQRLSSDEWLVVRGRAKNIKDNNAHVFSSEGSLLREFHLGDGIADCQTTSDECIWASYFDEGVYSEVPTGRNGLSCFDSNGISTFNFCETDEGLSAISDCYALNVESDTGVWLCYYTDFPIVELSNGRAKRIWKDNPITGSHAFAVSDDSVIFSGSYEKDDVLYKLNLGDMTVKEFNVLDSNGTLLRSFGAVGRGHKLFLDTESHLYEVDARCL